MGRSLLVEGFLGRLWVASCGVLGGRRAVGRQRWTNWGSVERLGPAFLRTLVARLGGPSWDRPAALQGRCYGSWGRRGAPGSRLGTFLKASGA
eukprot:9302154-Pyramimonas_sp.AAC.1